MKHFLKQDNVFYCTTEKGVYRIKIENDSDSESPRTWDNLGTIIAFGSHSYISDNDPTLAGNRKISDFWNDPNDFLQYHNQKDWIILPLYKYEHSGVAYSTTPFTCRWDSGQIGYVFCSKQKAIEEYGNKYFTEKVAEKAKECMKNEIEVFSNWADGNVYGYIAEFADWHEISSAANTDEQFFELAKLPIQDRVKAMKADMIDFEEIEFQEVSSCWGFIETTYDYEKMDCFADATTYVE